MATDPMPLTVSWLRALKTRAQADLNRAEEDLARAEGRVVMLRNMMSVLDIRIEELSAKP
jgi:hypothetical protein